MADSTRGGAIRDEGRWRGRRSILAAQLRRVREEVCGAEGIPDLARRLGVPDRTWRNYEAGITIPGEILLAFLDATGVDPARLTREVPEPGMVVRDRASRAAEQDPAARPSDGRARGMAADGRG